MTEKHHESLPKHHEQIDLNKEIAKNLERVKDQAEQGESHDHSIDKIKASIHKEAVSAREVTVGEHRQDSNAPLVGMQRELKAEAYDKTIQRVRNHLNPVERNLSKVIHHPVVEPISELSSKTLARPSGILGGGIAALVGSGAVLYMAKHYGFRYNLTTFLVLLVGGFACGTLVELIVWLVWQRKRSIDPY
jgi:hypothetical protein